MYIDTPLPSPYSTHRSSSSQGIAPEQTMPLDEPKLEIFRILADGNPLWVATVEGRAQARKKVTELIAKSPAQYKVYDSQSQKFIDVFRRTA